MIETISTQDVRQRLGAILNRVAQRHDQFIIERKGKPLAAVVPVQRLEQMRHAARIHLFQVLNRQDGKLTEAQADRTANEAKHRTRTRNENQCQGFVVCFYLSTIRPKSNNQILAPYPSSARREPVRHASAIAPATGSSPSYASGVRGLQMMSFSTHRTASGVN